GVPVVFRREVVAIRLVALLPSRTHAQGAARVHHRRGLGVGVGDGLPIAPNTIDRHLPPHPRRWFSPLRKFTNGLQPPPPLSVARLPVPDPADLPRCVRLRWLHRSPR